MSNIARVLAVLMLLGSSALAASVDSNMNNLAVNYQAAMKATTAESFSQSLWNMRAAALDAQNNVPTKLQGKAPDSKVMEDYRHGLGTLVGQIDMALELAAQGHFPEARAMAGDFANTRDSYHKKYR